jgi:hypothetical protein
MGDFMPHGGACGLTSCYRACAACGIWAHAAQTGCMRRMRVACAACARMRRRKLASKTGFGAKFRSGSGQISMKFQGSFSANGRRRMRAFISRMRRMRDVKGCMRRMRRAHAAHAGACAACAEKL